MSITVRKEKHGQRSNRTNDNDIRSYCVGQPMLTARMETWMSNFLVDHDLSSLLAKHGSPLNVVCTDPMQRNIDELVKVAGSRGCDLQIFFARKSNKCLSFVQQAMASGIGVDTASENELTQSLEAGIAPDRLICTAAVKSDSLVDRCIYDQVVIAVDNWDELQLIVERARKIGRHARIALRLGGFHHEGKKLPTRFGFDIDRDASLTGQLRDFPVTVEGIHFHLDGYDAAQRVSAVRESIQWINRLRRNGHMPTFIDMGGGFPMSYLDDEQQWKEFWSQLKSSLRGQREAITYRNHSLGLTCIDGEIYGQPNSYPYSQTVVRAGWLECVLDANIGGSTVAELLNESGIQLRCEPGRSLLDGCGMTVARVEFRKQNTDGDWLIGLSMNRTQCRTSSDDFLVDPILIPSDTEHGEEMSGYLVGAYCTESELLSLRRLSFPTGVRRGDLIAFPNTAGYLMHFLESRSHQFPLAKNVVCDVKSKTIRLDAIDGGNDSFAID